MGNSGSMNGLSAYDDGYHHHHHHPHHNHHHHNPHHHQQTGYHQHHQRYHDAMRGDGGGATSWLDSYQQQRQDQHQHDLHWNNNSSNNNNGSNTNHQQQLQQQIKVLPDIPGKVAKLRSTNNGNILHAGGTISKNNQLQRSKSISSPTYQHHQALHEEVEEEGALGGKGGGLGGELMCSLPPPRMLITRSRTQVSMLGGGAPVYGDQGEDTVPLGMRRPPAQFGPRSGPNNNNNRQPASYQSGAGAGVGVGGGQRKRFGSEPDLRAPHEQLPSAKEQHGAGGGGGLLRTPKTAQSKIMKGKNKKKAPGPPISSPEKQKDSAKGEEQRGGRIIAYSPLRKTNSDTSSTLPSTSTEQSGGGGGGGGRKLRLFKTRAETRKQPAIAKLPEASDAKFAKTKVGAGALSPPVATAAAAAAATNASIKPSSGVVVGRGVAARSTPATAIGGDRVVLEQLPAHPQLRSFFRREKTFDVGLLSLEGRKAPTKPTLSPPLSRRKSIVKSLLEAEPQHQQQQQQQLDIQHIRRSATAAAVTGSTARKDTGQQQQQQQARRKPSQMHQPTHQHPGKGAPNTLVIPVEPAEQAAVQVVAVPVPVPDATLSPLSLSPSSSSSTPPPPPPLPPPLPKSSFYFGMPGGATPVEGTGTKVRPDQERPERDRGITTEEEEEEEENEENEDEEEEEEEEEAEGQDEDDEEEKHRREEQPNDADRLTVRTGSLDEIDRTQMDIIDRFAASLLHDSRRFHHSTDSVASSEADVLRGIGGGGGGHRSTEPPATGTSDEGLATSDGQEIALRLRPTLPRKQFDIPRFSPAAAWRLLTTEDEFGAPPPTTTTDPSGIPQGDRQEEQGGDRKQSAYLARGTELDGGSSSEDRIERVYREPGLPGLQDNKSGDSGISGDAGEGPLPELTGSVRHRNRFRGPGKGAHRRPSPDSAAEEKTDAVGGGAGGDGTGHRTAATATHHGWSSSALTPWTPQQDLDDDDDDDDTTTGDSSSDHQPNNHHNHNHHHRNRLHHLLDDSGTITDHRDSQHHHHNHYHHNDFATKGHLFSLSLPRENHLSIYTGGSADDKVEKHVFNSLQKLRKTVSDAFRSEDTTGGGGQVVIGSQNGNDNWFLGRLDTKTRTAGITASAAATGSSAAIGGSSYDKRPYGHGDHHSGTAAGAPDCDPVRGDTGDTGNGLRNPKITSSSIGYLVSGRHMMYLPKEPTRLTTTTTTTGPPTPATAASSGKHADHNNNSRTIGNRNGNGQQQKQQSAGGPKMSTARLRGQASERQQVGGVASGGPVTPHTLPPPPSSHRTDNKENLQDTVPVVALVASTSGSGTGSRASGDHAEGGHSGTTTGSFPVKLSNRRHHRFTFQSTIRQIEKRRVAEKLSREAEIKEAMRLSELEAMRRVEEEFQRKRAREKASIRHQLRLFSMEDGQTVDNDMAADDLDMINDNSNDGHHSGREESRPYDGKRSDPDGDSLPHQNVRTPGRGLYRKRDSCSTIERQQQQQYKRSITQDPYPSRQPYTNASDPTEHANGDNDDGDNEDADGDMPAGNNGARTGSRDHDNDGDSGSSLGYVDTRTPYISRIIQAKSSKSGYAMHHKLRAD